jgi:hypothetical protein
VLYVLLRARAIGSLAPCHAPFSRHVRTSHLAAGMHGVHGDTRVDHYRRRPMQEAVALFSQRTARLPMRLVLTRHARWLVGSLAPCHAPVSRHVHSLISTVTISSPPTTAIAFCKSATTSKAAPPPLSYSLITRWRLRFVFHSSSQPRIRGRASSRLITRVPDAIASSTALESAEIARGRELENARRQYCLRVSLENLALYAETPMRDGAAWPPRGSGG